MRGVWRKEENKETSPFPNWSEFLDPSVAMNSGIVKHHKSILTDTEGKSLRKLTTLSAVIHLSVVKPSYRLSRVIIPKILSLTTLLGGNGHVLPFQLPPVWHIAFRIGMALVGIVERDETIFYLTFKLLQLLDLVPVELQRGYSPWAFPYTLISAPMLIKTFESHIARLLASCLFPCCPGFAHTLSVLLNGTTDNFLVRGVHDWLPATPKTWLEAIYTLFFVSLYPCVHGHEAHLRFRSSFHERETFRFQKNCTATHAETMFFAQTKSPIKFEVLRLG